MRRWRYVGTDKHTSHRSKYILAKPLDIFSADQILSSSRVLYFNLSNSDNSQLYCMDLWRTIVLRLWHGFARLHDQDWRNSGSFKSQDFNIDAETLRNKPKKPANLRTSHNVFKTELSDDTWDQYLDSALTYDHQFSKRLSDDLETLLLFAALFSAVVTAFLIESYKSLQPETGDETVQLLQQILITLQGNSTTVSTPGSGASTFTVSKTATRVNACWFASLILSLTTAFFAILAKQWILELKRVLEPNGPSVMRARMRQFYTHNAEKWKLYFVITSLPILLHISLLLFLIALVEWLKPINDTIAGVAAGLVYLAVAVYILLHIASLLTPHCPYRTSMTVIFDRIGKVLHQAWGLSQAGVDTMVAFQRIRDVSPSGFYSTLAMFDTDLQPASSAQVLEYMHMGISFIPWMIVRAFDTLRRSTWAPFTYYWTPTLVPSEVKYVLKHSDVVDLHALAWLIDRSSEFDEDDTHLKLSRQLCHFGTRLIPYRTLFLGRGLNLLVHQLRAIYYVGKTQFTSLKPTPGRLVLRYATNLARLTTEVAENESSTLFLSDGVPYHVDWIQRASIPILSIFPFQHVEDAEWTDTQDIRFFAAMLRLQLFASSTRWYWMNVRKSTDKFFELVEEAGALRDVSDEYLLVVINSLIYIGTCRVANRGVEREGESASEQSTAREVTSDNVLIWLRQHTPRTLDALSAVMLNRPNMPFSVYRQICWGIWALSGDCYFIKPLIPTITTTMHLSQHLARYMLDSSLATRPSLAHAVLVLLEGLLYSADITAIGTNAETSTLSDRKDLTDTLVERYSQFLRNLARILPLTHDVANWVWVHKLTMRMVRISGFLAFYYYSDTTEAPTQAPPSDADDVSSSSSSSSVMMLTLQDPGPDVRIIRGTLFMLQTMSLHLLNQSEGKEDGHNRKSIVCMIYAAACRLARLQAPGFRPDPRSPPPADFFVFKGDHSPQTLVEEIKEVLRVAPQLDNSTIGLFLPMVGQLIKAVRQDDSVFFQEVLTLLRQGDFSLLLGQSCRLEHGAERDRPVLMAVNQTFEALQEMSEKVEILE